MADMQVPNNKPGGNHEQGTIPTSGSRGVVHGYNQTNPGSHVSGTMPTTGPSGQISPPAMTHYRPGHSSQR